MTFGNLMGNIGHGSLVRMNETNLVVMGKKEFRVRVIILVHVWMPFHGLIHSITFIYLVVMVMLLEEILVIIIFAITKFRLFK